MEYVWRTTPDSLTVSTSIYIIKMCSRSTMVQLLDDDGITIGMLHSDRQLVDGQLVPAPKPGAGYDFLELVNVPAAEMDEVLGQ